MPRVKRGVTAHRRHKKILKKAKGYYGARSRVFRVAKQAVTKAGQYAYRDRRQRKRQFRALWITRINAAARMNQILLRWFTPEIEMDLCGHATLATAHCLKSILNYSQEEFIFETLSGNLTVFNKNDTYFLDFPSRMPKTRRKRRNG